MKLPIPLLFLWLLALPVHAEEASSEQTYVATVNPNGVQVVEVAGGGYFFKPDHIVVKANVPVEFKLRKESGVVPHDFVIDAPEAGVQVKEAIESAPKTIRVTFTKAGTYEFYCSKKLLFFKSHRDKGMKGTIEVKQ